MRVCGEDRFLGTFGGIVECTGVPAVQNRSQAQAGVSERALEAPVASLLISGPSHSLAESRDHGGVCLLECVGPNRWKGEVHRRHGALRHGCVRCL